MTAKQETCEDRIDRALESWQRTFQSLGRRWQHGDGDQCEEATERASESLLAVSKETVYKIEFSWGGPADWLEARTDGDGDIIRITYHYSDWFDHAERELTGTEFDAAELFIRYAIVID